MEYQHYIVIGYMQDFVDSATIEIFAEDEEAALSKAKKLVHKEYYEATKTDLMINVPDLDNWSRVTNYDGVLRCSHCGAREV